VSIAQVIVDVPSRQVDRPFDYAIPAALEGVCVGQCVLVDFGGRPVVGYVVGVVADSAVEKVKPVAAALGGPYFDANAVATAHWIAERYLCALSEALRLFLPPGGTPRVRRVGESWELVRAGVGPVDDRWATLTTAGQEYTPSSRATSQRALLDALAAGPVRVAELAADLGSVDGPLRRLEALGVVSVERRRRLRHGSVAEKPAPRHEVLTEGQRAAVEAIGRDRVDGGPSVFVLDGVTGSGKTEVYLRAIESVLEAGQTACVLVPEISLTPQTVGRFRSRFGDDIGVLHSRLSQGERFDQWERIRAGEARVVVGARSALFAPLHDLGLIVIDEEHEPSYKQGSAPRYHARDVAVHLAGLTGATVVLGSATPSMESLERCREGEWTRLDLPQRVRDLPMPTVSVVDMSVEFAEGNRSMFSRQLADGLAETMARGEKAVLFLNRRGFASFLLCRECGFVPECERCSTSLTYHEVGQRLQCHHCGATRAVPVECPRCGSPYLRQFGAGTQRVEAELEGLVPDVPVVRMDADTTRGKGGHELALAKFESLASGILLGTQMIAKGLDYPDVTLVGVMNADTTLHLPDFRAGERTFQLLEQVAGRAGRGDKPGKVVIQTYWPQNEAIRAAAAHDPSAFYDSERAARAELGYPPATRIANVIVRGSDRVAVETAATETAAALRAAIPGSWAVLGPSPAPLSRLKGVWRWHVLVKAPVDAALSEVLGAALAAVGTRRDVAVVPDIDPVDLL
jgi:primosomal protein N' (replication factor Y) (superfamily II helicase)